MPANALGHRMQLCRQDAIAGKRAPTIVHRVSSRLMSDALPLQQRQPFFQLGDAGFERIDPLDQRRIARST